MNNPEPPRSLGYRILLYLLSAGFIIVGVLHFVRPSGFVKIVPDYIGNAELLVAISGVFEVLGGIGLLIPSLRNAAAIGCILLLIAVFPANIYMLTHADTIPGQAIDKLYLWLRLPFQPLFIYAVWFAGLRKRTDLPVTAAARSRSRR